MANIVIIGAGVSGLSAGIFLRQQGYDVTVYERHNISGGNLTGWKRQGFIIDNCIHWLVGTNKKSKLYAKWQTLNAFNDSDVYTAEYLYKSQLNGETLALYFNLDKTKEEMLTLSPCDEKEILKLINAIKQAIIFLDESESLISKTTAAVKLYYYYKLNLYELADKFKHPLIKKFITDYIGGSFGALAYVITAAEFCRENAGVPINGSLETARRITEKFISLGGKIVYNEKAVDVIYQKNVIKTVVFESGLKISADYFVFSGDPLVMYGEILKKPMPKALAKRYDNKNFRRFSATHAAFSVDVKDLPFSGTYVTDLPKKYAATINDVRIKLREFSPFKYGLKNEKTVIQTISFCNEGEARYWVNLGKNQAEYQKAKTKYQNCVKDAVEEIFPSLKNKLTPLDCWTPYTYNRYVGSTLGEFMSFTLPKKHLPAKINNAVRGVENAVIASQWLTVPGGLPNALECGIRASDTVTAKIKTKRRLRFFTKLKKREGKKIKTAV